MTSSLPFISSPPFKGAGGLDRIAAILTILSHENLLKGEDGKQVLEAGLKELPEKELEYLYNLYLRNSMKKLQQKISPTP